MKPPPFNQKFCATPKIYKKLCCISKIVDFTDFFLKFLANFQKNILNKFVMVIKIFKCVSL